MKIRDSSPIKKQKRPASQIKNKSTQKDVSLLLRSTRVQNAQFSSKYRESSTKSPALHHTAKRTDRLSQVSFSQGYSSRKGKSIERTSNPFKSIKEWTPG